MSHVAERAGITRATLYKYFPDVRAILNAWQVRKLAANLHELAAARDSEGTPRERLARMLQAFAVMVYRQHTVELIAFLNSTEHASRGYDQLGKMLREVIAEGIAARMFRDDVPAAEAASFCTHALAAATSVSSVAAARRLASLAVSALER